MFTSTMCDMHAKSLVCNHLQNFTSNIFYILYFIHPHYITPVVV